MGLNKSRNVRVYSRRRRTKQEKGGAASSGEGDCDFEHVGEDDPRWELLGKRQDKSSAMMM